MSTRDEIIKRLDGPRCPREMAEALGRRLRGVQTSMRRLAEQQLIVCATPDHTQARLYGLTAHGVARFYELMGRAPEAPRDLPLDLYADIQASTYRRRALEVLDAPQTARQIMAAGKARHWPMHYTHLCEALADLEQRGVIQRSGARRWSLTPLGEQLRRYQLAIRDQSNGQPSPA